VSRSIFYVKTVAEYPDRLAVLVSRRNAPDVSYATWDTPPLPWLSARLRAAEESTSGATTVAQPSPTVANFSGRDGPDRIIPFRTRSESLAPIFGVRPQFRLEDGGIKPVKAAVKTSVMTRGSLGRYGKKRKTIDQLEWLGGVTTVRMYCLGHGIHRPEPLSSS
jgi:hypothetical protein